MAIADGAGFIDTYLCAPGIHLTRVLDIRDAVQHLWEVVHLLPDEEQAATPPR